MTIMWHLSHPRACTVSSERGRTEPNRASGSARRRAFSLIELSLVMGILVVLSAMIVPNFIRQIRADALPRSARQMRTLITLVRAHAAFDGLRYRIRFPNEDETDALGGTVQPRVEREDDPIEEPEVFNEVLDPWAVGKTLLGDVWCAEVRLERPTILLLQELRDRTGEGIEEALEEAEQRIEEIDPLRPPLFIEPDGTGEWAVFVLTTAPRETPIEELEDQPQLHLIVEGITGLAWMQRPFYEEELDLFEEKGWPAVLRQDFLTTRVLTEDDVLELRESGVRGHDVELKGRELKATP